MKSLLAALAVLLGIIGTATADPFGWGGNFYGQIGDGTSGTSQRTPLAVDVTGVLAGKTVTEISSSDSHTLCVTSDGLVYAWGLNYIGQLGDGTTADSIVPVAVDMTGVLSGKTITAVAAGRGFSLVLASDGTMYSWGSGIIGTLGNNSILPSSTPVAVDMSGALLGKSVVSISAAKSRSNAACVTSDGQIYAWGAGIHLGIGSVSSSSYYEAAPIAVDTSGVLSGRFITQISLGEVASYALDSDGYVYSWGENNDGELGAGYTSAWEYLPVAVDRSAALYRKTVSAISAGDDHCLALTTDGEVFSWGKNTFNALGDGTSVSYAASPTAVYAFGELSGKVITQIAAGAWNSQVLTSDGVLYGWGSNNWGQVGSGSGTFEPLPTAVDMSGVLAGMVATDLFSGYHIFHILASPSTSSVPLASRFTYAANFGWLNWRWSGTAVEAPAVDSYILAGKVYSANVGWIDLGDGTPTDSIRYSQSGADIGVNHDGAGALSGYAYGANIGWVTFDATIAQPPRINISTGDLSGYAYSANCGWIQLGGMKTKILAGADRDGAGGKGDGIADAWELELGKLAGYANGSSLLGISPDSDFDGDGVSDAAEYLADTNPFAADDALKVTHFRYLPATGEVNLNWTGSQRRSYTIYRSSDMVNWTKAMPSLSGNNADFVLDGPAQPRMFFRVGADLPLR